MDSSHAPHIVCTHCGATNRVPAQRLGEDPRCGRCGHALLPGVVVSPSGERPWSSAPSGGDGRTSLDGLNADEHIALFNALKRIEAALVKEPGDEMVCERARLAGTGRYEMACMTRRERDRRAQSAKEALMFRPACTTAECFGGD